jgi:hypothetical protein
MAPQCRKLLPNNRVVVQNHFYTFHQPQLSYAAKGSASNDGKPEFTFVRLPPPSCVGNEPWGRNEEIADGIRLIASVRLSSFAALIFCLLFHQGKSKRQFLLKDSIGWHRPLS